MTIETIRIMADEVASLMAARFGGLRRGQTADLDTMVRRRGAALPRKLRREAMVLAKADRVAEVPKLAKQQDFDRLQRAHKALVNHLRPLGQGGRLQAGAVNIGATLVFALLILGAIALWLLVRRGVI
ncbi:hypothetical protein [Paracoccus sulfuroxidans]|uniref:Uncharacterized protein n=1 Tax=Paracoccus sulfuroxidans TaxID=384678 RepID=A0A562NVE8_9RHOB|nr:hypothetical protein [Paracoccus sulfuroxidans]TWI36051.1 hypothetical protein IQ24_01414 [Paracoccus sulfuroxidans]